MGREPFGFLVMRQCLSKLLFEGEGRRKWSGFCHKSVKWDCLFRGQDKQFRWFPLPENASKEVNAKDDGFWLWYNFCDGGGYIGGEMAGTMAVMGQMVQKKGTIAFVYRIDYR